jgi:hypothetical protein
MFFLKFIVDSYVNLQYIVGKDAREINILIFIIDINGYNKYNSRVLIRLKK